ARVRAVVAAPDGREHIVRGQLTAGDGYMASNQRHVLLGLGDATHVLRLEVDWPSGARSVVESPAVDRELVVIER
ncbi:MAG TPA: ASPIC/UnbV domain-containing protein, partial [Pirellulaceae bacterium]|nr:ASPIC/UnbV domain-containing protein [Pirellulaceae bacterium]